MRPKSLYIIFFVVGLLIGILIGGFWATKQLENFLVLTGIRGKSDLTIVKPDSVKQEPKTQREMTGFTKSGQKYEQSKSLSDNSSEFSAADSTVADTVVKTDVSDVMIRKDKMLSTCKIPFLAGYLDKRKKEQYLDSLLIDDRTQSKSQGQLIVEFWNSPLNYRGYKMSKSKLILFGLEPTDDVVVKQVESAIYMKYGNLFFRLCYTDVFMPLQQVTNEALLKR